WRHRTPAGRITQIRERRLASLADRHLLLQVVELTPENYAGRVVLESCVDAAVPAPPLTPPPPALTPVPGAFGASAPPGLALRAEGTGAVIALAMEGAVHGAGGPASAPRVEASGSRIVKRWTLAAE